MFYRVIGLMSGSSLDGLDIAFVELEEVAGVWSYTIKAADCYNYSNELKQRLQFATELSAKDYLLLHAEYGRFMGVQVNHFIQQHAIEHQVQLIASHGHTSFHLPQKGMTAQLGDGAAIAATTGVNVVSDLRSIDVALGGQGAPIVPMGEKLLWKNYDIFLNIGGIANISFKNSDFYIAFDICAANRVLNALANQLGKEYDENGELAKKGNLHSALLTELSSLEYYKQPHPKSLANQFGTEVVLPLIESYQLSAEDALHTYVEHVAQQVANVIAQQENHHHSKMLVTGGGAFNKYLINRMQVALQPYNVEIVIPEDAIVQYKEAIVMALLGVLRWREENTVLHTVTGSSRSSIGGTVWIGQEA